MEAIPENIQRFNLTALKLFDMLYEAFPSPITVDPYELGGSALPEGASQESLSALTESERMDAQERGEQRGWEYTTRTLDVVKWLREEGFIRYDTISPGADSTVYEAVLTLKGLTVLGYVPTSLRSDDPEEPIIDKIKAVLKKGTAAAGAEAVKQIVSGVFKLAWQYGPAITASAQLLPG